MYKLFWIALLFFGGATVVYANVSADVLIRPMPTSGPGYGTACPMNYDPVCAVNGTTYGNECMARSAGAQVARRGSCADTPSPKPVAPLHTGPQPAPGPRQPIFMLRDGSTTSARDLGSSMRTNNPAIERARASTKRSIVFVDAAAARAEKLLERARSRIAKVSDAGAAADLVEQAASELEAARALIDELRAGVDTASGTNAKETFQSARDALKESAERIRRALDLIRSAVAALPAV